MRAHRPLLLLLTVFLILFLQSCDNGPIMGEDTGSVSNDIPEYDGEIFFEGRRYTYRGDAEDISVRDDAVIINNAGSYLLSGELSEGRVVVDCSGEVYLALGDVTLSSSAGAVISREEGDLIIESLPDTINLLSSSYDGNNGILPSGCIYAGGAVAFCGQGKIIVNAKCDGGVVCENMAFRGGELSIGSHSYGVFVKDKAKISGGRLTITHADVGIFAYGGKYSHGKIEMTDGCLVAVCDDTALYAEREILISGGKGDVKARTVYKCVRTENGKKIDGNISVYEGFVSTENHF